MKLCPVKVTAHLSSPLVLSPEGHPPYLDAVLEWYVAWRMPTISACSNGRHAWDAGRRRGGPVAQPGTVPILIAHRTVGGLPVPLCSSGIIPDARQRVEHYSRRFPTEKAGMLDPGDRGILATGGGTYKGFRLPLRVVDVDRVVWFAALRRVKRPGKTNCGGPMSQLRKLLRRIDRLGKKGSQGYGEVTEWTVEPAAEDCSWWADGVLMRPLPAEAERPDGARGFRDGFGGVVGPYWDRQHWREAIFPC